MLQMVDVCLLALLPWLALWIIISGLDDLTVDLTFYRMRRAKRRRAPILPLMAERYREERQIAVFVPLWHEHEVIERMVRHNVRILRYSRYQFFLGAYPNDEETLEALRRLERSNERIHVCVCPHDGPTSKADCLNWIYQHMLMLERRTGIFFDAIVTHDAEDVIHPDSLAVINRNLDDYDMVQVPVLPLATPFSKWTHAIYCDEFAESQFKDLPARVYAGGFLPSCGVGTGLSRDTVERLAMAHANRVFEPSCLTEDYELGLRVHRLGLRQVFTDTAVSTREFFPQTVRGAIRQRTRWIMGIGLQSWQQNGWGKTWRERYFMWRDRKGLIGNPLSIVANLAFIYGLSTWLWSSATGETWSLGSSVPGLAWMGLGLQCVRTAIRTACCARFYGPLFAAGTPLRVLLANLINFVATIRAVKRFTVAAVTRTPLVWLKTAHSFPSEATLATAMAEGEPRARAAEAP